MTQPKDSERQRYRDALERLKGGVRLLAEDLEAGRLSPLEVAERLHEGCDFAKEVLEADA